MVGLLYAVLDLNRNERVFEKYDRATAHELFTKCGLSKRLVDEFLKPTLLVGLFKPPEELSAAVTMELLYSTRWRIRIRSTCDGLRVRALAS